ncbi:MAG: AI-2E family transporter, partial [Planctomycetota bacterium]
MNDGPDIISAAWRHRWGRALLIAVTIACVSWAMRETAAITLPLVTAIGDVLLPLAIGLTVAYILNPLVDLLQRTVRKRVLAAAILYLALALIAVLLAVGVMPLVVSQGSDLLARTFSEQVFLDTDDDGRLRRGDTVLSAVPGSRDRWFDDRNGDGLVQSDEPQFPGHSVSRAPSLVGLVVTWAEQQRDHASNLFSDDEADAFLVFYHQHMSRAVSLDQPLRERWHQALIASREDSADNELPAALHPLLDGHATAHDAWQAATAQAHAAAMIADTRTALAEAADSGDHLAAQALATVGDSETPTVATRVVAGLTERVQAAIGQASQAIGDYLSTALTNIGALLTIALDTILVPIYAFFFSLALPAMRSQIRRYLPPSHHDQIVRLLHDVERVVAAFFRGRLIVCLICAALVWVGFALCGVPYAGLFGVLIGLATAVPLSGLLFLIPACLLVIAEGGNDMAL